MRWKRCSDSSSPISSAARRRRLCTGLGIDYGAPGDPNCYDIAGLPADNLQLEAFFGRLRRHQRRISGRKTTHELRDLGQCQALFWAETETELLSQLREVKLADYQLQRRHLAEAAAPRQFLHRLHRDPVRTVRRLLNDHAARQVELAHANAADIHNG
jgi:hypothetical protein